ncbi:MAG: hypothetical protein OHK0039_37130 [Bacteroidia bacterium]
MTQHQEQHIQSLIANGYEFKIGDYINRGFEIFRKDAGNFIGYGFLMIPLILLALIPILGAIAMLILLMPYTAGFYLYANKVANDEPRTFQDFFGGMKFTGNLLGMVVLMGLAIFVGFLLLIVPGIYLAVGYSLALPLVVLGGMGAWEAMETSRKIVSKNWWWFLLFGMVVGVISSLGQIALLIGMFVTMPIAYCVQYAAFEDIMGTSSDSSLMHKIDEIGQREDASPARPPVDTSWGEGVQVKTVEAPVATEEPADDEITEVITPYSDEDDDPLK